jgi:hypothetical protein
VPLGNAGAIAEFCMRVLTPIIVFQDNNAGVFHRLANDAEEEQSKEVVLTSSVWCRYSKA